MKKILIIFTVVFAVYHAASVPSVLAQVKKDEITAEEKKAVQEVVKRFEDRLDETGDVEPLIKEVFVDDFMGRYVKEKLKDMPKDRESSAKSEMNLLFEFDSRLFEIANDDDWKRFYISSFDLLNNVFANLANKAGEQIEAGKDPDDIDEDELVKELFPASVTKILTSNPNLKGLDGRDPEALPITTIGELRDVVSTLYDANKEFRFVSSDGNFRISNTGRKAFAALAERRDKDGDGLTVRVKACKKECFGFPKGTHLFEIYTDRSIYLTIIKVNNDYKIVSAEYVSLD